MTVVVVEAVEHVDVPAQHLPPGRATGRPVVVALLLLAAVACGVVAALAAGRLADAGELEARRDAALQAARQHVVNFTTIDHRTLERDLRRVLRGSTGDFRKEFRAGAADLSAALVESEAVSTGEVLEAGTVTADGDSARVLVVADSTVRNNASPEPQKRHYRMQVDLVRQGDRFLVSDLRFLG